MKADAPRQAVDWQTLNADQFREGAAHDAQEDFQLEGAVLSVTKAEAEPGVGVVGRLDVGDAPAVAVDLQRLTDAGDSTFAVRERQALAERPAQEQAMQVQRRRFREEGNEATRPRK